MSTYTYQVYYEYNGPTHADPNRERLSNDEVEQRLAQFFTDIASHLEDLDVAIKPKPDNIISITTEIRKSICDERVKLLLNELDLYAEMI